MQLKSLIENLDIKDIENKVAHIDIKGIACDSRKVSKDYIFVAIKGTNEDGWDFIDEAIEKGARVIVVQRQIRPLYKNRRYCTFIPVADTRLALAKLASEFYGRPSKKLKVIGITGTNGKTTISYLIESILKKREFSTGIIGTINYKFKDTFIPASNTTPSAIELQSLLERMLLAHIEYVVMEVSSHALDQSRVEEIDFLYAIFTNLTQDHLDYHRDLENYFQTKAKLFRNLKSKASAIINLDDPYGMRLIKSTAAKITTYALNKAADFMARRITLTLGGTEFVASTPRGKCKINTNLIGRHNVYNLLAAIALSVKEGIDLDVIREGIEGLSLVPGRLEAIKKDGLPFNIFVDYAHSEDALKNVLTTLRGFSPGKIILVFGCGGDRDRDKRQKMGRLAAEMADFIFITSDNPRSEEPLKICKEIATGIKTNNYKIVLDRCEAIRDAISIVAPSDIVLIAGKGHEAYQIFKDKVVPFDDRQVVRHILDDVYPVRD